MDTFLRSYVDEAGYVPLAAVCAYPNVTYFNVPVDALMAALAQACAQADSLFELDLAVGTIKLKNKWEMVRSRFLIYHTVTLMGALLCSGSCQMRMEEEDCPCTLCKLSRLRLLPLQPRRLPLMVPPVLLWPRVRQHRDVEAAVAQRSCLPRPQSLYLPLRPLHNYLDMKGGNLVWQDMSNRMWPNDIVWRMEKKECGVMFVDGCIFLGSGFDCGVVKCTKLLCILSYTTY
jgi:hypothetical protein